MTQHRTGSDSMGRRDRGFTVAEMSVSLTIMAVLLVAMGSAITISSRALPTPASPINAELAVGSCIDRLAGELRYAKSVESASATVVQFTVADRTGDGVDDHIAYSWAGAGSPLTRSLNGAGAVAVSDALSSFALSFQKTKVTTTQTVSGTVNSGEVLFTSCSGWTGLVPIQTNGVLNSASWSSSYFKLDKVTIPANATSIAITRVRVKLKAVASPNGATITCGIYTPASAGGPLPSTTQIGSDASIAVSTLSTSYPSGYNDFVFSNVTFAAAPTELNWVVKGTGTSCGAVMYYNNTLAPANNPVYVYTTNSGSGWSPKSSSYAQNDGVFEVYGTYSYPGSSTTSTDTYYLHTFSVAADCASPAAHAELSMRALNTPTIPGP